MKTKNQHTDPDSLEDIRKWSRGLEMVALLWELSLIFNANFVRMGIVQLF